MKQLLILGGVGLLALFNVSCETTNAKVGVPIPFTDPAVRVGVDAQVQVLPPKFCLGLTVNED
tara:strand:+ start:1616 stop:1804 length:189 start_codon:yes stop_codon:yes gene_type:complete